MASVQKVLLGSREKADRLAEEAEHYCSESILRNNRAHSV